MHELVLCFLQISTWWALWTLYDHYFIIYSPIAEILILLVFLLVKIMPCVLSRFKKWKHQGSQQIELALEKL